MDLNIVTESGDSFKIDVSFFDSFLEIKEKVQIHHGIPISKQLLFLDGQPLHDKDIILQTNLTNGSSSVHLQLIPDPPKPIKIILKFPGTLTLNIEINLDDTVLHLKQKIHEMYTYVPVDALSFRFPASRVNPVFDNQLMQEHGVTNDSTVNVLIKKLSYYQKPPAKTPVAESTNGGGCDIPQKKKASPTNKRTGAGGDCRIAKQNKLPASKEITGNVTAPLPEYTTGSGCRVLKIKQNKVPATTVVTGNDSIYSGTFAASVPESTNGSGCGILKIKQKKALATTEITGNISIDSGRITSQIPESTKGVVCDISKLNEKKPPAKQDMTGNDSIDSGTATAHVPERTSGGGDSKLKSELLNLKVVPMAKRERAMIHVEMESSANVNDLRKFLECYGSTFLEDSVYLFIYKQCVMWESKSFKWHGVKDGDTIHLFDVYATGN